MWFFQGALLKDDNKVLINAQQDKTKALRQWRFDPDQKMILKYVIEAIENKKNNKEIKADRNKPLIIPPELQTAIENDKNMKSAFNSFAKGKQREFAEHIASAKKEKTKLSRLKKIIPMIKPKVGFHDRYRT